MKRKRKNYHEFCFDTILFILNYLPGVSIIFSIRQDIKGRTETDKSFSWQLITDQVTLAHITTNNL